MTLYRPAALALATACAALGAMLVTKVAWIAAVASGDLGSEWLAREASVVSVPGWFGLDFAMAVAWGVVAGAAGGFATRPATRKIAAVGLGVANAAMAVLLLVSVYVYDLFGTTPTWQLVEALEGGGEASDSILALVTAGSVALGLVLLAIAVAGPIVLHQVFHRRRKTALIAASAVVGMTCVTGIAALVASPSALALDQNAVAGLITGGEDADDDLVMLAPAGKFGEVLSPISDRERVAPTPRPAYDRLRAWARKERRNVVLVVLESTAVAHMHVTGGKTPNTPNLDRLTSRAVFWRRHYAHQPRSMSSLYSITCGQYGRPFKKPITYRRPRIDCRSMSELLAAEGYRAGLFHSGTFAYTNKLYYFADRGYELLLDAMTLPGSGERYARWGWGLEEAGAVDAILDWVKQIDDEPFFVTYVPVYPHHPYPVPDDIYKQFPATSTQGKYENAMYYVDAELGRLMRGMAELGVEDDTLFVIMGDHGEAFGEHPGSKAHGGRLYEEQVRTFVLWYAPGALTRGYVDDRPFGHVDVLPTLLDLLSLPPQEQHPGISGAIAGTRPMVPLYAPEAFHGLGFVDGYWKFIYDKKTKRTELYDLYRDPKERRNVSASNPDRVELYRNRALSFRAVQKAWDKTMPDLPPAQEPHPGTPASRAVATWVFDPATCEFSADAFALTGEALEPTASRRSETVLCRQALPPIEGRVTSMIVRGVEAMTRANIAVTLLWESADGRRKPLVFSRLNGSDKKPAYEYVSELRPEMTGFGRGGTLIVELTFKYRGNASQFDPAKFRVDEVVLEFEHDGGMLANLGALLGIAK